MYNGVVIFDEMRNRKAYGGTTNKFGISEVGIDYIVKMKKGEKSSIYSEYVASHFIQNIGIPAHDTWLGFYHSECVVILKDFTTSSIKLKEFKDTRQSSEDTDISNKEYTYTDVLYLIDKHLKISDLDKNKVLHRFWQMFICDAILGNRDRHHGNWGYLIINGKYTPAPLYDNGGSLFPDVAKVIGMYKEDRYRFIEQRAEKFPASLFRMDRGDGRGSRRTNYYEMLSDLRINKILAYEVRQLREKVGYQGVYRAIINSVSTVKGIVPSDYLEFYVYIVCVRYLHLIERIPIKKAYSIVKGSVDNGE